MLPRVASIQTYDGVKQDYSAPIDSSTDRAAAGANPAYGDAAAATHTVPRAIATLSYPDGDATPTVTVRDEVWNNGNNAAPVALRTGVGVTTYTFPSTVVDEIPLGSPGYTGPVSPGLRLAVAQARGTWHRAEAVVTAPNVVTVSWYTFATGSTTLDDPEDGTAIDIVVY